MSRRDMKYVVKECNMCRRTLPSRSFLYSQKSVDHLEGKCRTCRSFLAGVPTLDQVLAYEGGIKALIRRAVNGLYSYDEDKYLDAVDIVAKHRGEFEQRVAVLFEQNEVLSSYWKLPVWVHVTSLPEGVVNA